jgi:hypothetical protein
MRITDYLSSYRDTGDLPQPLLAAACVGGGDGQ